MKNFSKNIIYILLFVLVAFFPAEGETSVGLSVSPQKFDLLVLPGDSYKSKFRLGNRSDIPLPVSVKVAAFSADNGTGNMRFESPDPDSPALWVDVETSDVLLSPGETKNIDFSVNVPGDVESGGYYVFVYFEPNIPSSFVEEVGPKTIPVVGVPFLIATTPLLLEPEGGAEFDVLGFSISKEQRSSFAESAVGGLRRGTDMLAGAMFADRVEGGDGSGLKTQVVKDSPTTFTFSIKNNDIYHIRPFGTLSVYNRSGSKIGEVEFKGQTILPGKRRDFDIDTEDDISLSAFSLRGYKAVLDVKAQSPVREDILPASGNPSVSFFSMTSLYILIFFLLFLSVVVFAQGRIRAAVTALIKG